MDTELVILIIGLFFMAIIYSSIGHGGASGYLALLSLTSFSSEGHIWLKQHAWSLNLIVAGLAFFYYRKEGYHDIRLTLPFILASIPFVILGSYVQVEGNIYDILLTTFMILAAVKLVIIKKEVDIIEIESPKIRDFFIIGGLIGYMCGILGIGGGVILTPIMVIKKWADTKTAAATSAIFIWFNSLSGLIGAGLSDQLVEFDNIIPFAIAVLIGGVIGSRYGSEMAKEESLKSILSLVLIIAASKLIISSF